MQPYFPHMSQVFSHMFPCKIGISSLQLRDLRISGAAASYAAPAAVFAVETAGLRLLGALELELRMKHGKQKLGDVERMEST